jgi:predicted transcriptional regulator
MKTDLRDEVMAVFAQLPENANLDDLIYALQMREHVQRAIEAGEADADAGRVYTSDEIRAEFKEVSKLEPE